QDTDVTNNQTEINNTVTTNEAFYFYDIGTKLLYDLSEKDKIRVNFLNIYNNLDYLEEATINDVDEALSSGITQRNLAAGIEYQRDWNGAFNTSLQVYVSNYDLQATNFDIINNQRLIQENEVVDTGIKLSTNYNIRDNLKWNNGYQFFEVGVSNLQDVNNPLFRSYIKEVIRSHSAFSELGFISNNFSTHLIAGLRGTCFEKFGDFLFEPRVSFNQRFLNYFKFEVLAEYKSQTTSQIFDRQNDFLGIEKRRWILANNADIPIIKSKQVSSGLHFKKNGFIISAEGYLKKVDGISTRSQGFQNQFQFVNAIGSYDIKGVDFLINKQFSNASIWLSYSYSKNDYTFDSLNNGISFPNNADLRHAVSFAGTYDFRGLMLALGANWRTGKPLTTVNEVDAFEDEEINFNEPNADNLDDYLRIDFSTTYNFDLGRETKAKVGLSVWNLLNKKNNLNTYYTLEDNGVNQIENQSLGITPNVTFRVNF
ncbi:MAG: TonB-dependent receptor, partial [Bacteroidia bacterium]|nr:TonB-dependent receptor [Bacteroidia bacterium]